MICQIRIIFFHAGEFHFRGSIPASISNESWTALNEASSWLSVPSLRIFLEFIERAFELLQLLPKFFM